MRERVPNMQSWQTPADRKDGVLGFFQSRWGPEVSQHSLSGECTRKLAIHEPRGEGIKLSNSLLMLQRGQRVGSGLEGKSHPGDLTIAGSDQSLPTPST